MSDLDQAFDVRVRVISQEGICVIGHKLGDTFYVRDVKTPGGICMGAYATITHGYDAGYGGWFPVEERRSPEDNLCGMPGP